MNPRKLIPFIFHPRLGGLVLGLSALGLGLASAQDRTERPVPAAERTPASRPAPPSPTLPAPAPRIRDGWSRLDSVVKSPQIQGDQASGSGNPPVQAPPPRPKAGLKYHPGTRIIIPPALERPVSRPNPAFWLERDLRAEIHDLSRSGFLPVHPISEGVDVLSDYAQAPAGWRAYGIAVPAGGIVVLEVQHPKSAWFRLLIMDKWGRYQPGMRAEASTPNPLKVGYQNLGKEATAVYIVVDDPAWWSGAKDPYTLLIQRDWHRSEADLRQVKTSVGLWGDNPIVTIEARYMSPHGAFFK